MSYYKTDNGISWQNRYKNKQEQELISNIKECTKCKTKKGLQEFEFLKATNFYNSRCRVCERKRATRTRAFRARKNGIMVLEDFHYSLRVLARERLASGKKVCAKCKELKSLIEFTRDISKTATADGYRTKCKKCCAAYEREKRRLRPLRYKNCVICIKTFVGMGKCCSAECQKKRKNEMERGYYYKNRKFFIAKNKLWERENIKKLGNKYIKRKLGIPDPPKEFIELKREHLKAKRAIRTVLSQ